MKALKCLIVAVAVVGLFTVGAQAADRPVTYQVEAEYIRAIGDLPGVGGVRSLGCTCDPLEDLGVLGAGASYFDYSVGGCTDDFAGDPACPAACGWFPYADGYEDGIAAFQVSVAGLYTISVCDSPYDNNVSLRAGGDCPGDVCVAQDDDSCGGGCFAPYQAELTGMMLDVGVQYYVIVDIGYGRLMISGPCTDDSECQDGRFCNGIEACVAGFCEAGETHPNGVTTECEYYQGCDDDTDECVEPPTCLAYLSGENDMGFMPLANLAAYSATHIADDIFLQPGLGTDLLWYYTVWYTFAGDPDYTVNMALHNNTESLICWDDWFTPCVVDEDCLYGGPCGADDFPGTVIAGSECSVACAAGGLCPVFCDMSAEGITLPDYFWIVGAPTDLLAGPLTAEWYARIGWSYNYMGASPDGLAPWTLWWFGSASNADMLAEVCVVEVGRCCLPGRAECEDNITDAECTTLGGSWTMNTMSAPAFCEDPDGDGLYTVCDADNCPDDYNPGQEDCNTDGEGDVCDPDPGEGDADGDGACDCQPDPAVEGPPCDDCDTDPTKTDPGVCGCGVPDTDTDSDGAADCIDPCPVDGNKWIPGDGLGEAPGQCGCGNPDTDTDGDGYADCIDGCPGVDNDMFPGCEQAIPTVTEWGLVILALLLLVAGKVYFGRRVTA